MLIAARTDIPQGLTASIVAQLARSIWGRLKFDAQDLTGAKKPGRSGNMQRKDKAANKKQRKIMTVGFLGRLF